MNAQLHVVSGARAGLTAVLDGEQVTLGRHPESRVQLHPAMDLEVSSRHAVLLLRDGRWLVRDLESRNGTYVNDRRIRSDTPLHHGDRIALGRGGPVIEFHLADHPAALAAAPGARPADEDASARDATAEPGGGSAAVRPDRRLRWLSVALVAAVALGAAALGLGQRSERESWEQERAGLESRVDSLLAASEAAAAAMDGMLSGLSSALRQSQEEIGRIGEQIRRAESAGDRSQISTLRTRLEAATVALDRQQSVAALDFRRIESRNRRAVAKVFVEFDDGEVATGTAFAVRPDATLVTSRHVVAGADGRRPLRRIAVQFSDSDQVWPARVVAVATDADLAVVRIDNIVGQVPTVQSLNLRSDTVADGAPVALIGYPLGGDASPDATGRSVVRPRLSAGVVSGRRADRFELNGYGAAGASGSPIFDSNGEVVAVLFGGRRDGAGAQRLYSVPASAVARMLNGVR